MCLYWNHTMKHKYPIGTRIKYNGCAKKDVGREGTIVRYEEACKGIVWIVIPNSYLALELYGNPEHEWSTHIEDLEILPQKNQQLLFSFMDE